MDVIRRLQYYSVYNAYYHLAKISPIVIIAILQGIIRKMIMFICTITLKCWKNFQDKFILLIMDTI